MIKNHIAYSQAAARLNIVWNLGVVATYELKQVPKPSLSWYQITSFLLVYGAVKTTLNDQSR